MADLPLGRMARLLGGETSANARALACVWAFGATCLAATLILPHPAAANDTGLAVIAAVAYPVAALMFWRAASIPRGALEAITYLGQVLIMGLTLFWNAPEPPYLWFHVWLVVHSFHFLPRRRATMQVACAAALFTVGTVVAGSAFPAATSVVGVGSIVTIGILVGAFRARVDELVRALERSASSDPLTGLANRRAFAEAYTRDQALRARLGCGGALLVLDCDGLKDSTTAAATPPATKPCVAWPRRCRRASARSTLPPGSAATSSPCCSARRHLAPRPRSASGSGAPSSPAGDPTA
jgi:hypothetical protein